MKRKGKKNGGLALVLGGLIGVVEQNRGLKKRNAITGEELHLIYK